MKYVIGLLLLILVLFGIYNVIEVRKLRGLKKQKEVIRKFIDQYMKLYWDSLPAFLKECKNSKYQEKKVIEKLLLERNHIYERMEFQEKLIRHVKIQELLEGMKKKIEKENRSSLTFQYQKLQGIEAQIISMSKEYEKLNKEISKQEKNPFLKLIFCFLKA